MGFSSAARSVKFNLNQLGKRPHKDYKDVFGKKNKATKLEFNLKNTTRKVDIQSIIAQNKKREVFWNSITIALPLVLVAIGFLFVLIYLK